MLRSIAAATAILYAWSAAQLQAQVAPSTGQSSQGSPSSAPANVGQAPMNSVMRQAQLGGSSPQAQATAPVQSTPTNAMTLTLRSSTGSQGQQGSSVQGPDNPSSNAPSYDAYGIRSSKGPGGSSSAPSQQGQSGGEQPPSS